LTGSLKPRPAGRVPSASSILESIGDAADSVRDDVQKAVDDLLTYLASPRGKELRGRLAMGLIALAPAIARAPGLRRHPLFRLLGIAGAATLLVKVGEAIRDWEPGTSP
jgi:hypothetical protein